MIAIHNIDFSIAGRPLFEGASATIPLGHKVGVVGRNGTGKTTLFRLIRGELHLDGGEIEVGRGLRLGGVAQEAPGTELSLLQTVLDADEERAELLRDSETSTNPLRIAEAQERLVAIESHTAEARASAILRGLGFDAEAQARPCSEYSGGWRMRVALAAVLFSRPDILLLDEPTNYLDLEGSIWLENFLATCPATVIVISHDRGLLNRAVNHILHLDRRKLTLYGGGYDQFEEVRRLKMEQTQAAAEKRAKARAHMQSFVDRFRAKASKAKQAQSRIKMLEKMTPIEFQADSDVSPFSFPSPAELPPPLMQAEKAVLGYNGRAVLRDLNFRIDQDDRIALLGANGQGKSTLAKLISGRLPPMEGSWRCSRGMKVGFFAQHQLDELVPGETPIQHVQRLLPDAPQGKLRAILARGGIGAEIAANPVDRLSGGQKARLLMLLAAWDAPHVLVLDEPTNHLDIESREALAQALAEYEGAVILISHDPHLVEAVADRLWLVKDGRVRAYDGDMEDYRRLLLSERGGGGRLASQAEKREAKEAKAAAKAAAKEAARPRRSQAELRRALAPLKAEVAKCEERIAKLEAMRRKIDARLMAPDFYLNAPADEAEALQRKRAEVEAAVLRAEDLWAAAQERLDAEESAA
ncbi:MAG: ABC-F family ATP-binding cassette domain-containing protein [Albimonas sp.]|uniref:ABC-F family ATP-binding cassette domain-containing protein n=1 Tax=Albimonas sp. TaxID=1872425 RepID=UPI004056F0F9